MNDDIHNVQAIEILKQAVSKLEEIEMKYVKINCLANVAFPMDALKDQLENEGLLRECTKPSDFCNILEWIEAKISDCEIVIDDIIHLDAIPFYVTGELYREGTDWYVKSSVGL
jgi:hypothetical protein